VGRVDEPVNAMNGHFNGPLATTVVKDKQNANQHRTIIKDKKHCVDCNTIAGKKEQERQET
jgi:hypothetical protein